MVVALAPPDPTFSIVQPVVLAVVFNTKDVAGVLMMWMPRW